MHVRTLLVLGLLVSLAPAAEPAKVGFPAGDFSLKDTAGKTHSLSDYKNQKAGVVVFLGTQCRGIRACLPVRAELHKEYGPKGVQFLAVNANRHDTPEQIAEHVKKHEIPF